LFQHHKNIFQINKISPPLLSLLESQVKMGVITLENEFAVAVAPAKLFKAYCLETDTLLPKILPEHIKSSEIIEGNGGPGAIRKITFAEG